MRPLLRNRPTAPDGIYTPRCLTAVGRSRGGAGGDPPIDLGRARLCVYARFVWFGDQFLRAGVPHAGNPCWTPRLRRRRAAARDLGVGLLTATALVAFVGDGGAFPPQVDESNSTCSTLHSVAGAMRDVLSGAHPRNARSTPVEPPFTQAALSRSQLRAVSSSRRSKTRA